MMSNTFLKINASLILLVFLASGSSTGYIGYNIYKSREEVVNSIVLDNKPSKNGNNTNEPTSKPAVTAKNQPSKAPQQPTNKPNNNQPTRTPQPASSGDTKEYYSPSLDITFQYNPDEIRLTDTDKYVTIYLSGLTTFTNSYGKIEAVTASSADQVKEFYEKKYTQLHKDATIEDENVESDSLEMTIKYQYKSFIDNTTTNRYQYIYAKKVDNGFIALDFTYPEGFDIDSYKTIFKDVVDSADSSGSSSGSTTSGTTGGTAIGLEVPDAGMQISADRKKWNVSTQTDSTLSMSFRSSSFETNSAYKYNITSIYINTSTTSVPVDEAYLLKRLSFEQDLYKDRNPTIITQDEKVEIDGVTFYKTSLSYTSGSLEKTKTVYWGYNETNDAVISISVNEDDTASEGSKEAENVINSITFGGGSTTLKRPATEIAVGNENTFMSDLLSLGQTVYAQEVNDAVEIESATIIGKSGVAHIFNKTCLDINVKSDKDLENTGGKTYNMCTAGFGTGFYVNGDGHVMTNAHVANPNPTDAVVGSLMSSKKSEFIQDFAQDVEGLLEKADYEVNSDEEFGYAVLGLLLKFVEEDIITLKPTYTNHIEGTEPFQINKETYDLENEDKHYKLETVDSTKPESVYQLAVKKNKGEKAGITVPDLTLLKVTSENKNFPALKLGNADVLNAGQRIKVIGFPGSANSEEIFGDTASSISTLTEGTISAIKPNFNNTFKMVQIDASVSFGNSGGPIINSNGDVIGVVTYKISGQESADFNAGVSVSEVHKMLKKNNVLNNVGPTHQYLRRGLNNLAKGYYKRAIVHFENVKKSYAPSEEVINPLISIAKQKVEDGQDKTPPFTLAGFDATLMQMILGGISLALFVLSGLLLIIRFGNPGRGGAQPASTTHDNEPVKESTTSKAKATTSSSTSYAPPKVEEKKSEVTDSVHGEKKKEVANSTPLKVEKAPEVKKEETKSHEEETTTPPASKYAPPKE